MEEKAEDFKVAILKISLLVDLGTLVVSASAV